jgi:O-antigen ligase
MVATTARPREIPLGAGTAVAAAAVAAALGAVAVYSPRHALEALLACALAALVVWRLPLGIAAFAVLTFPAHLPGSLGIGATLAKPVGAAIVLAWLAQAATRRGELRLLPRDRPALFWAALAFVAFGGTSILWASDGGQTRLELGRLVQVLLLLVVTYTAASSRAGFRTVVAGFLAGSAITSAYAIASGSYAPTGRLAGLFDPNYFAAELIPAILVCLFALVATDARRVRLAALAVGTLDLVAFVLTQSRGGLLGLAVALLAAVALAGRARPRVLCLVLVLAACGLGYYVAYAPAHVAGTFTSGLTSASSGRSDEWRIALRMLSGHPLMGVGLGNYTVVEPTYAPQTIDLSFVRFVVTDRLVAHSTYLEVAAELGAVGIGLFLAILAVPTALATRALRRLAERLHPLEFEVRGLLAGALGMFAAYAFISAEYEKQLWLVLGLLAAVPALAARRRRS